MTSSLLDHGRLLLRAAVVVLVTAVAVPGATGIAAAADGSRDVSAAGGAVTPFVDCVIRNGIWNSTVVLGYSSDASTDVTIPLGRDNYIGLARTDGARPTTFHPGTQHGVLSVHVGLFGFWSLDGTTLFFSARSAPACPDPTVMPADGNDTGSAIALISAGVVGAVLIRRLTRRRNDPTPAPTAGAPDPDPETIDA